MFEISSLKDKEGGVKICSVIPLRDIRRSVHLFPRFGRVAPADWTSNNVLDQCDIFYLNDFTDRHLFRIICNSR